MAMDDLYKALSVFKQGVGELQLSRTLDDANQQVASIKNSDLNEQQQRAQLFDLSHQLVSRMGQLGAPVSQIEQQVGAIAPRVFKNANEMNAEAQLSGNAALGQEATNQQGFENNKAFELAKIKQQGRALADASKGPAQAALFDKRWADMSTTLDKRVDTQTSRFGNISKLQTANNAIVDARSLLEGDLTPEKIGELAKTYDKILSGGAPTLAGTASVSPHTLQQMIGKAKEFATSDPAVINMDEFKKFYKDSFDRLEKVNNKIINDAQAQVIKSSTGPAKFNPQGYEIWAQSRGHNVKVNPKTGEIKYLGAVGKDDDAEAPARVPVNKRDKLTGKIVQLFQDKDGNLFESLNGN